MLGDISLTSSYSFWFFPLCFLLGTLFSIFFYYRSKKFDDIARWKVIVMIALRSIAMSILLILLLDPVVKSQIRTVDQPIIIIAKDNSKSLRYNNTPNQLQEISLGHKALEKTLAEDFEIRSYSFGDKITEGLDTNYSSSETNLSLLLDQIEQRYENRNVGAVILFSDGIYNRGSNPVYSKHDFDFPLHTVGLGDTARRADISIKKVLNNDIAYLNNKFPIRAEIQSNLMKGTDYTVELRGLGKKLESKRGKIEKNNSSFTIDFEIEATSIGIQPFEIIVTSSGEEQNTANNKKTVFVDILDGRQNVLLLANSTHPDVGAINSVLSSIDKYKIDIELVSSFQGDATKYDLVIFHQIPSNKSQNERVRKLLESDVAKLFFIGQNSRITDLNRLNLGLKLKLNPKQKNDAQPLLLENFSLFSLSDQTVSSIQNWPPLFSPFGEYEITTDHHVLFTQKIGTVESNFPLIAFNKSDEVKNGFIFGEGVWRWKLWDYRAMNNNNAFNELISKTVQYLAVKADKSRLRISSPNRVNENEQITFDAELYNESYELVNDQEIELLISDSAGSEYSYVFTKTNNAYTLNAGSLPVGKYDFKAQVPGSPALVKTGNFIVTPIQLEAYQTVANHELLFDLSQKYGGQFVDQEDMSNLVQTIKNDASIRPITHIEEVPKNAIHFKWLFAMILAALTFEWFMRKRNGAY